MTFNHRSTTYGPLLLSEPAGPPTPPEPTKIDVYHNFDWLANNSKMTFVGGGGPANDKEIDSVVVGDDYGSSSFGLSTPSPIVDKPRLKTNVLDGKSVVEIDNEVRTDVGFLWDNETQDYADLNPGGVVQAIVFAPLRQSVQYVQTRRPNVASRILCEYTGGVWQYDFANTGVNNVNDLISDGSVSPPVWRSLVFQFRPNSNTADVWSNGELLSKEATALGSLWRVGRYGAAGGSAQTLCSSLIALNMIYEITDNADALLVSEGAGIKSVINFIQALYPSLHSPVT